MSETDFYLQQLAELREAVRDVLLGLPKEGLNWKPLPEEANSIYVLAKHSAWVEEWWIGCFLGRQPERDDRADDLEGTGEDAADLLFWLDEAATTSKSVIEQLRPEELEEMRTRTRSDGSEEQLSCRWTIVHTIEHYAEHIGQMRLTRQLWEAQRAPT
jgi:uncharacterized damage-inducible protein DinB